MRLTSRSTLTLVSLLTLPLCLSAQEQAPPPPPPDTTRLIDTAPVRPLEPTADQQKYLRGMRTAARGIAQLRTGVDGVTRAEASKDTTRLRRAGRMLAGLCGTARTFMRQGRTGMQPTVYEDSMRLKARRLALVVDTLVKAMTPCQADAGKTPARVAADLALRLKSYETALQEFRAATLAPTPAAPLAQPPSSSGQHTDSMRAATIPSF